MRGGYHEEAMEWRDWLLRAVAGDVSKLQIMYGPAGERRLDEWEADWLPGYEGSKPVRIGNAASGQFQLDVYGEVLSALYEGCGVGQLLSSSAWDLQVALIEFLADHWKEPDDGIWEVRGPRRHFTHSKVMAWVAVDRAVRTVEEFAPEGAARGVAGPAHGDPRRCARRATTPRWARSRSTIGADALDASLLMIPLVGFLPATDPRVRSTIEAIERDLTEDGFVLRYGPTRPTPSTASPATRAPSWRARSGWRTAWGSSAATTTLGPCSSACWRCATTWGCWPRSMTPSPSARSGTSPRRSRTCRW